MIEERHHSDARVTPALRGAAVCAMLTAFTTGVLIGVPYLLPAAETVDASMQRAFNPLYLFRLVVGIAHPLLVLIGVLGVAVVAWRRAPGRVFAGALFFALWAFTEAIEQSILLASLNLRWRREYLATSDRDRQAVLQVHAEGVDGITDGLFLLILIAFIVGNALLASALLGRRGRDLIPGACFVIGAALGVVSLSQTLGSDLGGTAMDVLYPALQPAARFVVGLWLWQSAPRIRQA